jgi:hypothetical protein
MTRASGLWGLFVLLAAADATLAVRRGIPFLRGASAWILCTVLLCAGGAAFGYLGNRITFDPYAGGLIGNMSGMTGVIVGAPIGAILGALAGIAVSERGLAGAWPAKRSLAFAALTLVVVGCAAWWMFAIITQHDQQAGRQVFVVLPVLGLSAVLGWLLGTPYAADAPR